MNKISMTLDILRKEFYPNTTMGDFCVDGNIFSHSLEDTDRQRQPDGFIMPWRKELKVYGATAIAYGTYEVIINWSNAFKRRMPLVLNVPDYLGIRIHNGITHHNTEGCPLIGYARSGETLIKPSSDAAFKEFFALLDSRLKKGKVFLNIRPQIIGA